jgi:hypothetical protein
VFGTGGDPLATGIVASLARPGGNATGVANRTNTLDIKRLELLRDLLPEALVIGMVLNPKNSMRWRSPSRRKTAPERSAVTWSWPAPARPSSWMRHLPLSSGRVPERC